METETELKAPHDSLARGTNFGDTLCQIKPQDNSESHLPFDREIGQGDWLSRIILLRLPLTKVGD